MNGNTTNIAHDIKKLYDDKKKWSDSQREERGFVINRGEEGRDRGWWGGNQPSEGCSAYCDCSYSPTIPSSKNRTRSISKWVNLNTGRL